jgi:hypothetical protein
MAWSGDIPVRGKRRGAVAQYAVLGLLIFLFVTGVVLLIGHSLIEWRVPGL